MLAFRAATWALVAANSCSVSVFSLVQVFATFFFARQQSADSDHLGFGLSRHHIPIASERHSAIVRCLGDFLHRGSHAGIAGQEPNQPRFQTGAERIPFRGSLGGGIPQGGQGIRAGVLRAQSRGGRKAG